VLRQSNGTDDAAVTRAPAEMAGKDVQQLVLAGLSITLEQRDGRHHEAWSAEPALQPVLVGECPLHGMQLTRWRGQALDRPYFRSVDLKG
jgi:hypothetical protein